MPLPCCFYVAFLLIPGRLDSALTAFNHVYFLVQELAAPVSARICLLRQRVVNLSGHQNPLEGGLVETRMAVPDSADLEHGPRMCISNKLPGEAGAAG